MSLKLKNVISREEDLTLPIPLNTTPDEIDSNILEINRQLDDLESDNNVIDQDCQLLDEVVRDVDELEGLRSVVETQLLDPEYQGLDEVSSEIINIKIRSIYQRRGLDMSRLDSVFSGESFNLNVRDRRRRTEVSMEGLAAVIKGAWDKIKRVISSIWESMKVFWKKHFTILGSLEVELEKLKKKIKNKTGYPDATKVVKAPDKMMKMYRPSSNLTIRDVGIMTDRMYTSVHTCTVYLEDVLKNVNNSMLRLDSKNGAIEVLKNLPPDKMLMKDGMLGSVKEPLINGMYGTMEMDTIGESEYYTLEFKWEEADPIEYQNQDLILPSKDDCVKLIDECIGIVKQAKKFGEMFQNQSGKVNQSLNKLTNLVNGIREEGGEIGDGSTTVAREIGSKEGKVDNKEAKEGYREVLRFYQDVMKMLPKINSKMIKGCIDTIRTDIKYLNMVVNTLVDKKSN